MVHIDFALLRFEMWLTPPYGHNGAYPTLWGILKHHLLPTAFLANWTQDLAALPDVPHLSNLDFLVLDDSREMARFERAIDLSPQDLSDNEINDIIAFLNSLTGKSANRHLGIPDTVQSGLPIDRLSVDNTN